MHGILPFSRLREFHDRINKVYADYAEPDADFDALAKEQARLEDVIQASDAHNLDHRLEVAADSLRLPPWDADVTTLSGGEKRRVALCRLLLNDAGGACSLFCPWFSATCRKTAFVHRPGSHGKICRTFLFLKEDGMLYSTFSVEV